MSLNINPTGAQPSVSNVTDGDKSVSTAAPAPKPPPPPPTKTPQTELSNRLLKATDQWARRTGVDVAELDTKQGIDKLNEHLLQRAVDNAANMPELKAFVSEMREIGRPHAMTFGLPLPSVLERVVAGLQQAQSAAPIVAQQPSGEINLRGFDSQAFVDKLGNPDAGIVTAHDLQQFRGTPAENNLARALLETVLDAGDWDSGELLVALQNKVAADEALHHGVQV